MTMMIIESTHFHFLIKLIIRMKDLASLSFYNRQNSMCYSKEKAYSFVSILSIYLQVATNLAGFGASKAQKFSVPFISSKNTALPLFFLHKNFPFLFFSKITFCPYLFLNFRPLIFFSKKSLPPNSPYKKCTYTLLVRLYRLYCEAYVLFTCKSRATPSSVQFRNTIEYGNNCQQKVVRLSACY